METQVTLDSLMLLLGAGIFFVILCGIHLCRKDHTGEPLRSYPELRRSCENVKAKDFKPCI